MMVGVDRLSGISRSGLTISFALARSCGRRTLTIVKSRSDSLPMNSVLSATTGVVAWKLTLRASARGDHRLDVLEGLPLAGAGDAAHVQSQRRRRRDGLAVGGQRERQLTFATVTVVKLEGIGPAGGKVDDQIVLRRSTHHVLPTNHRKTRQQ